MDVFNFNPMINHFIQTSGDSVSPPISKDTL